MIRLENIEYYIGDIHIIRDVSLEVDEGETLSIIGQSGSGKSTLLKLILGLSRPTSGRVYIDNIDITDMKEVQLREVRKRIGMVFQAGALFDSLTVGENVGYYLLEHSSMKLSDISEEVQQMLSFVGLPAEIIDRLPDELSGGQQRRVAIARALLSTKPRIMLYDEPTTGLDPEMTDRIVNLIMKIKEPRNVSQIVVTHQIADAFNLADRFVMIDGGRKIFDGDGKRLLGSTDESIVKFLRPFNSVVSKHCELLTQVNGYNETSR